MAISFVEAKDPKTPSSCKTSQKISTLMEANINYCKQLIAIHKTFVVVMLQFAWAREGSIVYD